MLILAVNGSAVNGCSRCLPHFSVVSKSVGNSQYSDEKCLVSSMKSLTRVPYFSRPESRGSARSAKPSSLPSPPTAAGAWRVRCRSPS